MSFLNSHHCNQVLQSHCFTAKSHHKTLRTVLAKTILQILPGRFQLSSLNIQMWKNKAYVIEILGHVTHTGKTLKTTSNSMVTKHRGKNIFFAGNSQEAF